MYVAPLQDPYSEALRKFNDRWAWPWTYHVCNGETLHVSYTVLY